MRWGEPKKETKEEYDARKTQQEAKEEKFKKESKELIRGMMKANECPRCKEAQLKKFKRKNYPFGRKSKPIVTVGKRCPNCGYTKLIQKDKNGKNRRKKN